MDSPLPLISVITVVYNGAATLERTIKSVLAQSYQHIEYVVIDGGSTDGTVDIIKKYADKIAYWVSERDGGIYDAMNKGVKAATGNLIGILNSDDYYEPDAVQNILDAYSVNQAEGVYFGGVYNIIYHGDTEKKYYLPPPTDINLLEKRMSIAHGSAFISKSLYDKHGLYDLKYRLAADYELFLRLKRKGAKFIATDNPIYYFSEGGASVSRNIAKEGFDIHRKYGNHTSGLFIYITSYLKKTVRDLLRSKLLANSFLHKFYVKQRQKMWQSRARV